MFHYANTVQNHCRCNGWLGFDRFGVDLLASEIQIVNDNFNYTPRT